VRQRAGPARPERQPEVSDEAETASGRRASKRASVFRTIGEVAEDLDLPAHVLRFWESKFPQLKPLKRGGGRRYYRPEDIALLARIRECLYQEGYTIRGVQKLLAEGTFEPGGGEIAPSLFPLDPLPGPNSARPARRPAARPTADGIDESRKALLEEARRDLVAARDLLDQLARLRGS
jgi:DNA-binding transcriptional MerR regulator